MTKSSNSRKRTEFDGSSSRRKARQVRLGFSSSDTEIAKSDLEKMRKIVSEQQFENNIAKNQPLDAFERSQLKNIEQNKTNDLTQQKINELNAYNQELEAKIRMLEEANEILKNDIAKQNKIFLQKIQEKTNQAQKLVDEKIAFYESKKNEEVQSIKNSVFEDVCSAFLEPIILLQSIIKSSPSDPAIANYLQGFNMLLNQFDEKLKELGVYEINVNVGDAFNELYMEAFDVVENSEYPPNTVVKVVKKGFVINENKVLKHTLVVVSK